MEPLAAMRQFVGQRRRLVELAEQHQRLDVVADEGDTFRPFDPVGHRVVAKYSRAAAALPADNSMKPMTPRA